MNSLHNIFKRPRHDSLLMEVISVSTDCISLTSASLSIREHSPVVPLHDILNDSFDALVVHLQLCASVIVSMVKGELLLFSFILVDSSIDRQIHVTWSLGLLRGLYHHLAHLLCQLEY
jgi:hypothetical protein